LSESCQTSYVSPIAAQLLPFSPEVLRPIVGLVEIAVGISILGFMPAIGAYVASGWLLLVAFNLVLAGYFDVAVRDVVLSIASFTLARLLLAREELAPPERAGAHAPMIA
jgi:hypothetical protein